MEDPTIDVLKDNFRQLRSPTMGQEFEKLARDAAATNQNFFQFLLRLTETELATRAANAIATRIKNAEFPVLKDFDTSDFTALPHLSKPKIMELARCEWIENKYNCCLVGSHGTGKTHGAVGLGLAACRAGLRVRFFTAAELVRPSLQRVEPDLPGRADDCGAVGPPDPPLPHFRDEWRELPLSRVDEIQEGSEIGVKSKLPLLPRAAILRTKGGQN